MNEPSTLFQRIQSHTYIFLVFMIGLVMRLYMAHVDPFLHEWDEKYHALVAKNMMQHPFKPMMYLNPVINFDYTSWCCNQVWLHKQPLFLWQMALSMKLFGVSAFAMRLPSVLMGSLTILLVYRICLLLSKNKQIALLAAILMCCSNYQLNLISGRFGMDHNDMAFGFYVLASFWAYFEYLDQAHWKWVFMIGICAGAAVLNKWLTGLLVFGPWALILLRDMRQHKSYQPILQYIVALVICAIIFLPWQWYIFHVFPKEAAYEFQYNSKHIFEALEGHTGDVWYYLNHFQDYFGMYIVYLLLPGFFLFLFKKDLALKKKITILLPIIIVFCFFSFVVQTKVSGYFFVVAPFCIILMAIALHSIISLLPVSCILAPLLTGICCYYTLAPLSINEMNHDVSYRQSKIYNTEIYKQINQLVPDSIHVVMNINQFEHVDVMFYNEGISAYHYCLSEEEMALLAAKNIPIAVFEDHYGYLMPEYVKTYKNLFVIRKKLKS